MKNNAAPVTDQLISVRCPATVANLVCGFDILGLADVLDIRDEQLDA